MSKSEVILEHHGCINLSEIELILAKIKKTAGFLSLPKVTGKRTYSVLVECLENINKHSASVSTRNKTDQPYISVSRSNDKVVITARNPVIRKSKDYLSNILDELNNLDSKQLRDIHRDIISRDFDHTKKGAGLGLINMKMISEGNLFRYSYSKISDDYLNFELLITINN